MSKYPNELLNYFYNLQHVGEMLPGKSIKIIESGSTDQGQVINFFIRFEKNTIIEVKFKCYGSVVLIGVCEFVSGWLEGKSLEELSELTTEKILSILCLDSLHKHVPVFVLQSLKTINCKEES